MYSIKELADLAGVTRRTLRYYDQLGILVPAVIGDNGYRYYDHENLLRLQQVLFYRELDVSLKDIQQIMEEDDFQPLLALKDHQEAIKRKILRLEHLLSTLDLTIKSIEGENHMTDQDIFNGFDETKYAEEAADLWGNLPQYKESQEKWISYSEAKKDEIIRESRSITLRMVTEDPDTKPDDPEVQAAVEDYYQYLNRYFYSCDVAFFQGLADMWVQDSRFALNYERIREGGAAFVREAVHIYCNSKIE
jgi:DNA-binding transcriptional MerR regulator